MSGWSAALRAGRRDALRAPWRTALVLLLIALPVTAIVAGDTLRRTAETSIAESLPQRIGAADAMIRSSGQAGAVDQDPTLQSTGSNGAPGDTVRRTTGYVLSRLPAGSRLVPVVEGDTTVPTAVGQLRVTTRTLDLRDPLTRGLYPVVTGRLPRTGNEVAVSTRVADRGYRIGATLPVGGRSFDVVAVVRLLRGEAGRAYAVGLPGTLTTAPPAVWLARVPAGLSWTQVRELNRSGLFALSRRVVRHPPPASELTITAGGDSKAFVVLLGTLALLQIVLLAAPAFVIGARRQRRVLALLGATGAEPAHVRRFVLAQGVVLGGVASCAGAALGLGAAAVARPLLTDPGPFEVSATTVLVTVTVGALSAVLAALVPALIAGEQDVLAGLTGRRGASGRSLPTFGAGLVLFGVGVFGGVLAARPGAGMYAPVLAAVPTVLGASLLGPAVLALLARAAGRLPFPLRFALRDAARTRGRTSAAAAAVTVMVAGVVALGIGGASDAAQERATYAPTSPRGTSLVIELGATAQDAGRVRQAVEGQLPGVGISSLDGPPSQAQVDVSDPAVPFLLSSSGGLGTSALIGDQSLSMLGLTGATLTRARDELARGHLVVPADQPRRTGPVVLRQLGPTGEPSRSDMVPAYRVASFGGTAPVSVVMSQSTARRLGVHPVAVALLIDATLSADQEQRVQEALQAAGAGFLTVERGYQDRGRGLALLLLGAVGGVLLLGGTLSAALLALSDARPDFATLMAVGAPPTVRRAVAAAYAAVIGLLGALLGAAAGFVPGVAVSFPLTRTPAPVTGLPSSFLDIPWLLVLYVVLGVPLLAALGAAGLTRSRLPLTVRTE